MTPQRDKTGDELTHSQLQLWLGQKLQPDDPLYNMAFAMVFPTQLQAAPFQEAWSRVVGASDVLGISVVEVDGVPRRRPSETGGPVTELIDFSQREQPEQAFRSWAAERASRPLPLEGELVESVLATLGDGRTGWYLNQHHLITDAWSTILLYREVGLEYAALIDGEEREPAPLFPYYPTAEALLSVGADHDAAREHWNARLEGPDRAIPLYGRPPRPTGTASVRTTLELDERRSRALDELCKQAGFKSFSSEMSRYALFATLLIGWLRRVSDRSWLGFDAPIAGRPTAEAKNALGLFIEMFPFAASVEQSESFRSLGAKCLEEVHRFLRHALPGTSAPSGAGSGNVVLNYFPLQFGDFAGAPVEVDWVHPAHADSVHALRLQVHDFSGDGRVTLHFDFNETVFSQELRERSLAHFEALLDALIEDPDQQIDAVDILREHEREALSELDAMDRGPLPDRSVCALFREALETEPGRVALRQGASELSFAELDAQVTALAATLVERGVEAGDRVAIVAKRSIQAVVAILAVLRARAAYVPIDPSHPVERSKHVVDDSGARLLLFGDGLDSAAQGAAAERLAISEGVRAGAGLQLTRPEPELDDLAYLLYTSGSTGLPKGVLVEHAGLADYLTWAARRYVRGDRLSFALFTSLSFDLTVTSLFLPLITGGTLEIYPESDGPVDRAWMDVVEADAVDFIKLTPSHLSLIRKLGCEGARFRRVVIGGEDLHTGLAAAIQAQLGPDAELHNEYGPTEAIVGCVVHRFDPETDTARSVPIGRPADHVALEILDEALEPVPVGVPGELWIARHGLARGYHGRAELSAERFQTDPARPGLRRYRTGDRVRLGESGLLEYLGRMDRQLKLSGFRVEPGEIEATLGALPAVAQCAVVARRRQPAEAGAADEVHFCVRCGLPSNYPRAVFDQDGVCNVCRTYEVTKEHAQDYFKTMDDLRELFAESAREHSPKYDCMMLLSGGKDSSYALCQLVDMGLSVYAYSLDNGYISDGAKENVRQVTKQLGVTVEFGETPAMNAIFKDSLTRYSNVCHGCFKTIYTLSTSRARELGIPIIVTGLSRGQMFETRLTEEMFRDGRRSPEEVDAAVLAARKIYHRVDDEVARSLDVSVFQDDKIFEEVRFVDFYRYLDVDLNELLSYLGKKVQWVRPADTGRSTNCLINDVGIYVHKQERGYHNYALPYSWDVRLGHKTREQARAELDDEIDEGYVRQTLAEIGYEGDGRPDAKPDQPVLIAYYTAAEGRSGEASEAELKSQLAERLPAQMIPTHLRRVDSIPLTPNGKVDEVALLRSEAGTRVGSPYRAPSGPIEEFLVDVWQEELGLARVGADDSFFELGGTSLLAMEAMIRLCREFDLELPLETLFSHPTVRELARAAEESILADVAEMDEDERRRLLAEADPNA